LRIAETERLVLRELSPDDAVFICELLNDPSWLRNIGDRNVRTPQEAKQYIQDKIIASYKSLGFGMYLTDLKNGGGPIGLCGLVKRDSLPAPDVGFALLPRFWNRGYALEATKAVMNYASTALKLSKLLAIVKPDNVTSIKLLERSGFSQQGVYRPPNAATDLKLYAIAVLQSVRAEAI
jgi:RimJ/RimL family protein N-acetyltransferase